MPFCGLPSSFQVRGQQTKRLSSPFLQLMRSYCLALDLLLVHPSLVLLVCRCASMKLLAAFQGRKSIMVVNKNPGIACLELPTQLHFPRRC